MAIFTDLHLNYIDENSAHQLILQAGSLGYSAVALSYTAFSDDFSMSKGKRDKSAPKSDLANPITLLEESSKILSLQGTPIQIFKRLSVPATDPKIFHDLANHPFCKSYDIISVAPSDDKLLQQALDDVSVDIIELELGSKRCISVNRKHARQAQATGKFFEISYRNALGDAETRAIFFANCRRLLQDLCPGDSGKIPDVLLLSSGISTSHLMKSPLEVGFLCDLFGFPVNFAKRLNAETAWQALQNSLAKRRTARNAIQILDLE